MVSLVTGPVTKLGLRRDIKYFLGLLVGYYTIFILALLILLQSAILRNEEQTWEQWNATADLVSNLLERHGGGQEGIRSEISALNSRFGIASIRLESGERTASLQPPTAKDLWTATRVTTAGRVTIGFDDAALRAARKHFARVAAICITGSLGGTILLLLYLPRIVRPLELLLDQARELGEKAAGVDEAHYLVETFRKSIDRLKTQEVDLKRLHDLEKTRADELERITATLTRSLASGFLGLNAEGILVEINSAGSEILNLPTGETSGKMLREILGTCPFSEELEAAIANRSSVARRELLHQAGETARVIGMTTVPLFGEEDDFLGMIVLFTDLTHIRHLEAQLQETETLSALGEISAGIAHEFRNSLSTILGYLKLAQRSQLPAEALSRIRNAQEEAGLLSSAVEGLLNFARPMKMTEFQPVGLLQLTESVLDRLTLSDPTVEVEIQGEEVEVTGDRSLLARAIENLLRNALESIAQRGEQQGHLHVAFFRAPYPGLSITDNGVGLAAEMATRLFLPFQSDKPGGFGMGLALTKKILLLHGASIRLAGVPGRGATATVEFQSAPQTSRTTA